MKNVKCKIVVGNYESGQVLLISLLVLVVILTVGLSAAVRSITTTRMTSAEDSSQRAFSAAEAGLERALTADVDFSNVPLTNSSSYSTTITESSDYDILVNNGAFISKDDAADVWLSSPPDYTTTWPAAGSSPLTIYWGKPGELCDQVESNNTMAAMEVILISGSEAAPTLEHFAFDPCGVPLSAETRRNNNHFDPVLAGGTIDGQTFAYSATINVTSGLIARLVPIYAGTKMAVSGGAVALPAQGKVYTSIGKSGGTQRKIVTFRGYPKPPIELYPYLIFSPKN